MEAGPDGPLGDELNALRGAIDRQAAATEAVLSLGSGAGSSLPGHQELWRQLTALRQRVERALRGTEDPREARAELATLLFFARTLRGDAEVWRAGLRQAMAKLERQEAAVRRERERLAAERAELLRRRQALQIRIDREAVRIADMNHGECRRTLPVITLHPGLTVCSMTVSRARRRFRSIRLWLVTLDEGRHDILVRPD